MEDMATVALRTWSRRVGESNWCQSRTYCQIPAMCDLFQVFSKRLRLFVGKPSGVYRLRRGAEISRQKFIEDRTLCYSAHRSRRGYRYVGYGELMPAGAIGHQTSTMPYPPSFGDSYSALGSEVIKNRTPDVWCSARYGYFDSLVETKQPCRSRVFEVLQLRAYRGLRGGTLHDAFSKLDGPERYCDVCKCILSVRL